MKRHMWKLVVILLLYGLAGRWDYEDSQKVRSAEYWARVANR